MKGRGSAARLEPKLFGQTVPGLIRRRVQCKGCRKEFSRTTFERKHIYSCHLLATHRREVAQLLPARAAPRGAAAASSGVCGSGGSSGGALAARSEQQSRGGGPDALESAGAAGAASPACSAGAALDLDVLGACWSPSLSRSTAIAPSPLPALHAGLAALPGRAAVAPQQSSDQPRAAWQVDLPLEDKEAFEDLAADAGLSEERYGELSDFVEAPDGQDSVPLDAEGAEDSDTEAESEAEEETGSPGGRRGAVDRLLERLGCELYLGAGPGKSLLRFAYQVQLWSLRNNTRSAALQELLAMLVEVLPPGNLCPATIYQLDKVTRCSAASLAAGLEPDKKGQRAKRENVAGARGTRSPCLTN